MTAEQFINYLRAIPANEGLAEEFMLCARIVFINLSNLIEQAELEDGGGVVREVIDCKCFLSECAIAAAQQAPPSRAFATKG